MEKTWRWFGKKDKITLDMLRQIGVEGIVTAFTMCPMVKYDRRGYQRSENLH